MTKSFKWAKERVQEGLLTYQHIAGSNNPSDILTKFLPFEPFSRHRKSMGLQPLKHLQSHKWVCVCVCCIQFIVQVGGKLYVWCMCLLHCSSWACVLRYWNRFTAILEVPRRNPEVNDLAYVVCMHACQWRRWRGLHSTHAELPLGNTVHIHSIYNSYLYIF